MKAPMCTAHAQGGQKRRHLILLLAVYYNR